MMKTPVQIAEERILLEELAQIEQELVSREHEDELRRCRLDPWYFFQTYVYTVDETDHRNPLKKYPDFEYCHDQIRIWEAWPRIRAIALEKSRRVIGTITWVNLLAWDCLFNPGRLQIIISQNEEKANRQIEQRAWIMYVNLPDWMKNHFQARKIFGKFIVPGKDVSPKLSKVASSLVWSVPQENEQARGETAANFLLDEVVAQTEAEKNIMAIIPAAEFGKAEGPRVILISTAGRGIFERVVKDML